MDKPTTDAQMGWTKILTAQVLELTGIVERTETKSKHARDCIDEIVINLQNLRRTL